MVYLLKITSITTRERTTGNPNIPQIFGAGEDGLIYEWSYEECGWKKYTNKED